jgi:hypothetical protein
MIFTFRTWNIEESTISNMRFQDFVEDVEAIIAMFLPTISVPAFPPSSIGKS